MTDIWVNQVCVDEVTGEWHYVLFAESDDQRTHSQHLTYKPWLTPRDEFLFTANRMAKLLWKRAGGPSPPPEIEWGGLNDDA